MYILQQYIWELGKSDIIGLLILLANKGIKN